ADGPHHYHPACGHKGSSHLSPVANTKAPQTLQVHVRPNMIQELRLQVPSFGGHCCPGVSRSVPADDDLSLSRYVFIQPSSFSSIFTCTSDGISGLSGRGRQCFAVLTGVTVTCA
ncbi:unnamed protein product, partial [Ascophyllum nodosum]